MNKKTLALLLAVLMMALAFGGCGAPKEEPAQSGQGADEAADSLPDYTAFAGTYYDSVSQRAVAEVVPDEEGQCANVVVSWSSSAFELSQWTMTVTYNNDLLSYTDCCMQTITTKEDGTENVDIVYTDGTGFFRWQDGILAWTGAADKECAACRFEKAADAE